MSWPSAESGALPIEGGVAVAFRREIAFCFCIARAAVAAILRANLRPTRAKNCKDRTVFQGERRDSRRAVRMINAAAFTSLWLSKPHVFGHNLCAVTSRKIRSLGAKYKIKGRVEALPVLFFSNRGLCRALWNVDFMYGN